MIDQKDVTIIIPHLGASEEQEFALDECLKSLNETVPDIKKMVVSNGDTMCGHNEVSEILMSSQGQCKAVNAGVSITETEWILVTNDDMVYPPGWWEKLIVPLGDQPISCLSPMLIEPNPGSPTFEVHRFGGAAGDFNKQAWLDFAKDYPIKQTQAVLRTGFNLPFLIARDLWDTINGYDVAYDPFGSNGDSDLQAKIHLAGVQPYQNTNAIVYHFSQTSGTSKPENRPYWQKNWNYFVEKWGFDRQSAPDVWFSKNIINHEKLKYKPDWMDKYGKAI